MEKEMLNWDEQSIRDMWAAAEILKNKRNMQQSAAPELDANGVMRTTYVPPPSLYDLSLQDLGKQTFLH